MNKTTIVVAGGKGERMHKAIPKQFLLLGGKIILMHTLEVFHRYDENMPLILVIPTVQIDYWKELCKKYAFDIPHQVVAGGNTRFQSVKNGLKVVQNSTLVAIHDGVRPFVSMETIARCFDAAQKHEAVIPVIDPIDSIRELTDFGSKSVDRQNYKFVQTPQVFNADLLKKAYEQEFEPFFTDDASVVESLGTKIHLVEGNRENIKITTEFDLKMAEITISFENSTFL